MTRKCYDDGDPALLIRRLFEALNSSKDGAFYPTVLQEARRWLAENAAGVLSGHAGPDGSGR